MALSAPHADPVPVAPAEDADFDGGKIRILRKVCEMSLVKLSAKSELSVGYLSQIERNISIPSLRALRKISHALGVTVGWFFNGGNAGPGDEKGFVVRKGNRRRIMFRDGFVDYLLSPSLDGALGLMLSHFDPGATTAYSPWRRRRHGVAESP